MGMMGNGVLLRLHRGKLAFSMVLLAVASLLLGFVGATSVRAVGAPEVAIAVAPKHSDRVGTAADTPAHYSWEVTCGSAVDCPDLQVSVALPEPLQLADPITQVPGREVGFDPNTREYTVKFQDSLGDGRIGLAAGALRTIELALVFPADAGVVDGQEFELGIRVNALGATEVRERAWLLAEVPPPVVDPAPADPSTPADPSEPADPSTPADPSEPADPSTPADPSEPADPNAPVLDEAPAVVAPQAAASDSEVSITKAANVTSVQPGQEFKYTITAGCSSLTTPCLGFNVTDTLPAEFEVTSLPQTNSQRDVTFDAGTRLLTVLYKIPVAGGTGLPAGQSQSFEIGMRLPAQTPVLDGTVINNEATVGATNAAPAVAEVDITATIPVTYTPIATKSWTPTSGVAQSDTPSTISLGVRNGSTTSAQVKELIVSDTTVATFDRFDVTSVGTLLSYPSGADQVFVDVCFNPIGTACADGDWVTAGPQSGAAPLSLTPPVGDLADATGVRYRFGNSDPAVNLPYSPDTGRVAFDVVLRDTYRQSGAPIEPTSRETVTNCAVPALTNQLGATTTGANACANFSILPGTVNLQATKDIYPDNNGTFSQNGAVVLGQNSGVSMNITGTNKSEFPIGELTIREPSTTAAHEFDKIDATKGRFSWPAGATTADLKVTCRTGANPATVSFTRPPSPATVDIASFGCDPGAFPSVIELVFTGLDGAGEPTIAAGAAGVLRIHGNATGVTSADVADRLGNCADVTAQVKPGGGSASAVSQACDSVPVENPTPGVGSIVKSSRGVDTMTPCPNPANPAPGECQPMTFDISFRNSGNIPVSNIVIADPVDPANSAAPFDVIRLQSLSLPSSPAATAEVYDPTAAAYVPYVASDTALLARAIGFRVTVTGNLPVGATYRMSFKAVARDTTPVGSTFTNCVGIGIGAPSRTTCSPAVQVGNPSNNAALQKLIVPGVVTRPTIGLPPQTIQVRQRVNTAANGGNMNLKQLIVTDTDADFFDAVTFAANINVNFPQGANRVQVDVCTSAADCAAGVFSNGTPTSSNQPGLPGGVVPAQVKGIRVTFTNSSGGYDILPSNNVPNSQACPNANVCFNATVRETLASSGMPIPNTVDDTITGAGESALQTPGTTFPIPPVSASFDVIQGSPRLSFDKGPDSRLGPGDSAPFNLTATNSGTSPVVDPVIVDPLPADLTAVPGVGGVPPYTINYVLPAGYPEPATVEYTEIKGDPSNPPVPGCTDVNRVCKLSWSFPGFNLPPGGKISVQFNVELTPGVVAGATITNTAGVHGANPDLSCAGASTSGPPFGTGLYCTDPAQITSVAGNNFKAEKWIKADPALGFIDGGGNIVPVGDAACPVYQNGGDVYTRYPCVARVLPGQQIDYLIRGINSGTNPASQIVIVDGLPVSGDNGVLLTSQQRGTEWNNRPIMLSPVTNVDGYSGVVTEYTDAPYMSGAFCRNSIQVPPNDTCPPGSFSAGFSQANTGFRTTMTFPSGDLLQPGESFTLVWSMQAPLELSGPQANPVAWNSFAYRPSFQTGQAVDVLPPTEPLKVGVAMPLTTFNATKAVEGLPPGITLAPFELAYSCSVTTAGSGTVVVSSGAFTLTDGATWTSPNIPDGATCRVWETNSQGGTSANIGESNAAELVLDSAEPNAVTITNSYEAGSLSIAKSVIWDAVPPFPVPPVEVVVNCGFPTLGDTLPGYPQTFDLFDGATPVTLVDLPVGTSCDITEANSQGATKTIIIPSNDTPTVGTSAVVGVDPADQGGTSVMIENIYQTGGLQIIKQVTGEASGWSQGPFVFDVSCVDPGSVLPPINRTVTLLPANLSTTISPIPAGYECTVTETSAGDATGPLPPPQTVTIPYYASTPPGPVTVTFVNDFPAGHIGVTKTVTGSGSTPMLGATFTVNIRCERTLAGGGTQQLLDESVVLSNGQTVMLPDPLPMGTQCFTTETESRGAGQVTINPTPVTITPQTPDVTVSVTNDFTAGGNGDGSIMITKVLTGAAASYAQGPFVFETVCTLGGYTMPTITTQLTPTSLVGYLTGLPVGASCEVSETNNGGASGGPIPPFVVDTVTVPAAGAAPVSVTATNDFPAGSVAVSKSLSGAGAGPMAGASFTVQVTCERELIDSQGTEVILDETVTIQGGQTVTLPNVLPIGATCYATETNSVGAGLVTISNPQGNPVQITDQTPNVSISVDNNYLTGGLILNKVITGAAASYAQGPFVFSTVCTLGGFTLPTVTSTLTPTSLTATLAGLPVGAVCVVTETNNGGASTPTVPVVVGTVMVPAAGAPAVTVTATNDFPAGSVSVTKTLSGAGSAVMAGATYTMQVTCERDLIGGGTEVIVNSTVPVSAGQTVTLPDILPIGARCWLAETDSVGAGTVTISNPENNPVLITDPTPTVTISVDNNYQAGGNDDGSIVLTKVISGAAGSYAQGPFVFQTVCTLGGFTLPVINTTLTPTSLTAVYQGLPVGASCVVTETNNGGASTPAVPFVVDTVTVPAAGVAPVTVTATNNFPAGSIAVAKTLSGGAAGVMANAEFTVQVTCTRELINGQGSETILDETVAIKGGQTVVLPDVLPIGAQCYLAETNSVGAGTVTISNPVSNPIQITDQTPNATISVDNNYEPGGTTGQGGVNGGIQVTKVITGSAASFAQGPFTFTADCTLAKFQLPLQTLTLSPTELVGYFGGLPVGAECALAETEDGNAPAATPISLGTVTVPAFTAPPVAVTATNDFPGAVLTVAKTVVGPGSGAFPFAVNCQASNSQGTMSPLDISAAGTGGTASAPAATFTLANGETWRVTVPAGAQCTVQETDARGGTATYSQGATGGAAQVTLTTDQTVTATNTFQTPPVPPTSSTNSGSGLARSGGGNYYAQLIGLALLLLLGGGVAVRLTRE